MLSLDQRYPFRGHEIAWGSLGSGPPLVLVHGFPWSSQCWRKLAPWLAKTHQVFVFDMLGTGQSDKPVDMRLDESVQSDLLVELMAHWQLERPRVIAHDFGGLAALRGHFLHGLEYRSLHLIDAVALLPSGSPFYRHVAAHEEAFAGLPDYAHEALFRAYIQNAAHLPLSAEISDIYLRPYSGEAGRPAFYRQIAHASNDNIAALESLYAKPDFPVHIIWGEKDSFIPIERGRRLADLLHADSFTPISGAAHLIQEDAPEALLGAILTSL